MEADKKKIAELFKIFEANYAPKKNVTIQRKLFYERQEEPGETVDDWMTQLRLIVAYCKFHDLEDILPDMLVLNSTHKQLQEKLLETDDLDLSQALKIAKDHETHIEQMKL
ncbi:MAG: hypothetical protein M3H12_05495 [Chromatiales bacterium]